MAKIVYCLQSEHIKADVWCKAAFWGADRARRPTAEGVFSLGFVLGFPSQSCPAETGSGGWRYLLYFSTGGTLPFSLPPLSLSSSPFILIISLFWNLSLLPEGLQNGDNQPQDCDWYAHGQTSDIQRLNSSEDPLWLRSSIPGSPHCDANL